MHEREGQKHVRAGCKVAPRIHEAALVPECPMPYDLEVPVDDVVHSQRMTEIALHNIATPIVSTKSDRQPIR